MTLRALSGLTIERAAAAYGREHASRVGVLSEHVALLLRSNPGSAVRALPSSEWVIDPTGRAWPVLCSEIVPIETEDGLTDGRCGELATTQGCCEPHAEDLAQWRALGEAERLAWERAAC